VKNTGREVAFNTEAGLFVIRFAGKGRLAIENSFYCPEFGRRYPNQTLAWTMQPSHGSSGFCFSPGLRIDRLDLKTGAKIGRRHFLW
jgi:hypothetical protein